MLSPLLPVVSSCYPQAGRTSNSLVACPDGVNWWEGSVEPRALLSQGRHQAGGASFQSKPVLLGQPVSSPFPFCICLPHTPPLTAELLLVGGRAVGHGDRRCLPCHGCAGEGSNLVYCRCRLAQELSHTRLQGLCGFPMMPYTQGV